MKGLKPSSNSKCLKIVCLKNNIKIGCPENPTRKSPIPENPKPEIPDPRYIGYRGLQNPPKPDRVFLFRAPTRPDPIP